MFDMHSHILPAIDDGSKNLDMSLKMLKMSYEQGIEAIVATPHFYISHNSVEHFLHKRERAYNAVMEATRDIKETPKIALGAEVLFFNGISAFDDLDKLTINNSNFLLLEMPFSKWNDKILREVETLCYEKKYKIIIAHIERFIGFQKGTSYISDLLNIVPLVQMNGEYINGLFTRKKALKLIKDDVVQLIGSDCHNLDNRAPNLDKAYGFIQKKLGQEYIDKMDKIGYSIINSGIAI